MAKVFKKFKKFGQYWFFALAVVLVILVGLFVIWSVVYLGESFNEALAVSTAPPPQLQFDIQGFQKLNLNQ